MIIDMLFVFFGKKRKQIKQWMKQATIMMIWLSQASVTLFLDDCFLIRGLSWESILSSSLHLGLDLKPTNKGEPVRTAGEKSIPFSSTTLSFSHQTDKTTFLLSQRAGLSLSFLHTWSFGIEETDTTVSRINTNTSAIIIIIIPDAWSQRRGFDSFFVLLLSSSLRSSTSPRSYLL